MQTQQTANLQCAGFHGLATGGIQIGGESGARLQVENVTIAYPKRSNFSHCQLVDAFSPAARGRAAIIARAAVKVPEAVSVCA